MGLFGPSKRERELEARLDALINQEKQKQQEALVVQFHDDVKVIKDFIQPLIQIGQNIGQVQTLVEGLMQMCKVSADQLDEFKKAVDILQHSLQTTEQPDYDQYAEDTPAGKARMQRTEIVELMRKGLSEDQARARLRERDIYAEMSKTR